MESEVISRGLACDACARIGLPILFTRDGVTPFDH